jgi:hypothetical protein
MRPLNWAVDSCADADVVVSRNARAPTNVRYDFIHVLLSGRPATKDEIGGRYYQRSGTSAVPSSMEAIGR